LKNYFGEKRQLSSESHSVQISQQQSQPPPLQLLSSQQTQKIESEQSITLCSPLIKPIQNDSFDMNEFSESDTSFNSVTFFPQSPSRPLPPLKNDNDNNNGNDNNNIQTNATLSPPIYLRRHFSLIL
jgi:hypothetical protein